MSDRFAQAAGVQEAMVAHRRHLHRHPEVGIELPDTHAYVARALTSLGLEVEAHPAAGVTARVAGTEPDGAASVLRADLDALPVTERTGLDFASEQQGAMHACGHDLHTAMLLGAAAVLAEHPPRRDTVLVFQPGEESDRGALAVLEHASLDVPAATAFALHVHAMADPGTVLWRPGVFMAYGDWFTIDLAGPGGHASQPHLVGNPIEAAAEITTEMRRVTAELSETELVVATVTESRIGNTVNVIPSSGRLRGTLRTLSASSRSTLVERLHQVVDDVARAHELQGEVAIHEGYPAVVNDSDYLSRLLARVSDGTNPPPLLAMKTPSMVIEDFAYFLHRWPGAMVYLGARGEGNRSFNHADDVVYDEGVLSVGAALHLLAADGV